MNKPVVIFTSKYGSAKRYAEWISDALSCPLYEGKNFPPQDFAKYDIIIYGGGLYAGSVNGANLLLKNRHLLAGKKVILFTCGLANPEDAHNAAQIRESLGKTFSPEMLRQIQLFHFRGGIDYAKLSFVHKAMMSMFHKMVLKQEARSPREENRAFLETYGKCVDFTERNSIQPLVDACLNGAPAPM